MQRKDFSDQEWRTLQYGPYWAFMTVSDQDRKVDDQEKAAFLAAIDNPGNMQGQLSRELVTSLAAEREAVFQAWQADARSPADGFAAINEILAKVDADEANRYKGLVIWLAIKIAGASGPWFGDKITADERQAVMTIATVLNYNLMDAAMATTMPGVLDALPR
jgi:hypothetical protein